MSQLDFILPKYVSGRDYIQCLRIRDYSALTTWIIILLCIIMVRSLPIYVDYDR